MMLSLKTILKVYGVEEKGFSKFYSSFKLKLQLNIKSKTEEIKLPLEDKNKLFLPDPRPMPNLSLFEFDRSSLKVPSIKFSASSSEQAVVAGSTEQVDKRRAETLNKLVQTYASLYIKSILDPLSKAQKSISSG
jgi:hypothetical protein